MEHLDIGQMMSSLAASASSGNSSLSSDIATAAPHFAAFAFAPHAQQLLLSAAATASSSSSFLSSSSSTPKQTSHLLLDNSPQSYANHRLIANPQNERCAVCSDQAQGIHFGVLVCRACAAFFRRSTIAKRVYHCRFDGNCPIDQRQVRCSCRACRLAKCLALGMDPNAVQKHRDQIGSRKRDRANPIENVEETRMEKYYKEEVSKNHEGNMELMETTAPKIRFLARTSTEETEPHIQGGIEEQQTCSTTLLGDTCSALLPSLTLMMDGSAFQQQLIEQQKAKEHNVIMSLPSSSHQQQHHVLHCEDGKSYTLLGSAAPILLQPSSIAPTLKQDPEAFTSGAPVNSLSDLLLRALPSAFSPLQGSSSQQHSTERGGGGGGHPPTDSGNVSASSSAFSSPLNLTASSSGGGQQNSPMNPTIGISPRNAVTATGANSTLWINAQIKTPPSLLIPPPAPLCSSSNSDSSTSAIIAHSTASTFDGETGFSCSSQSQQPLLNEMLRGYLKFRSLRRTAQHLNECPFAEDERNGKKHIKIETTLVEGTYSDHAESIKADLSLLSEMLDDHFPHCESNSIPIQNGQCCVTFFCTFIIAERCHVSTRHFPGQEDTRLFCSDHTYLDMSHLDRFFAVEQCRTDPADIAKVFQPVFFHFQKLIRQPMDKLRLSEMEFVALLGLLFWNHRIDILTDEERPIVIETRERIFTELHQVCRLNAPGDEKAAGIRFCTLVNMFHFCQREAHEIASAYSLVNVVQKFETDQFLNQFHPLMF